jgi:alpha-mannosidase
MGGQSGLAALAQPMFDLSREKVLYCVGYAHLDTQWRWDFPTTIDQYIRDTLDQNFERFEKFPGYVFNFTGSVRYEMMKEYYPDKYERLKRYVSAGKWHVSGSSVDEGDVNVPSAEAIIRQVLYGNQFFRREFGKESVDFMLPDCFGFPASLPSIWAHCGLIGFSTQKLTWGSAVGIPFKVGVWEGPDGKSVIAALDPGPYVGAIKGRVDTNSEWIARVNENGRKYGVFADYHYYGVGDQGGAPREEDVANYLASMNNPDSQIKVALVSSDQMYKDITPEMKARLPRYKGDLLLTEHSAGTLTSQSYMKRWNRKNEILADAAERAAVVADWLGGAKYPRRKLYQSWVRTLANQMHDILPGTSIPRAYRYSWNDELVAMNGFAAVLTDSVGAVARELDTRTQGAALVVFNPLAIIREDPVEAFISFPGDVPNYVRVFGPDGEEVPSQLLDRSGNGVRVLFMANVGPLSFAVFDVRPAEQPFEDDALRISETALENAVYRIRLDENGNVAGIVDRRFGDRELLAGPAKLVFTFEKPRQWPAWNMDWEDRQKPPIDVVAAPAKIRIVERGPVRAAWEIERSARNSVITQRIQLTRGDSGTRLEFHTTVDWQSAECALKASFPLTVSNPMATYNWGMGTIERRNNEPTKYEVPSHEWIDLTNSVDDYGISILEDSKYGSDKPSDNEIRLTLLYTPGVRSGYLDQHSQDWGRHEMVYAIYGHRGDWRTGATEWQARRLNQPLRAFQAPSHPGLLQKSFSLLSVDTPQIDVRTVKLAEDSRHIVVRLQELHGRNAEKVEVTFARSIRNAYEVDGQERRLADANYEGRTLLVDFTPFSPRSFAVELNAPHVNPVPPRTRTVQLPFNVDIFSTDMNRADGAFDATGRSIPAEMISNIVDSEGVLFWIGPTDDGQSNAVACRGQIIPLPDEPSNRIYLLAAAEQDVTGRFVVGEAATKLAIQSWTGFIGQWDDRRWDRECAEVDYVCEGHVTGITPGYIKRDNIAWYATHRHHPQFGNEAYRFSYLFKYRLDRPPGAKTLQLPDDPRIKIVAATIAENDNDATMPAAPLYDDFTDRKPVEFRHVYPPPPIPVFTGQAPLAEVIMDRKHGFADLAIGPPSPTDIADIARGYDNWFRFFDGGGNHRPHRASGAVGDRLPRLNDGLVAQNDDDTTRCVWYDDEGRFFVNLTRPVAVARINIYSWHRGNRAPQFFSLWGANTDIMPSPAFAHGQHGPWKLIAVVDSRSLGHGGVHGTSVVPPPGRASLGPFRHLLWIAENVGQGTFFTEIDIHDAE